MKHVFLVSVTYYNAEMRTFDLTTELFTNKDMAKAYLESKFLSFNGDLGFYSGDYEYFNEDGFLVKEQPDVEGFTSDDWYCIGKIELKEIK